MIAASDNVWEAGIAGAVIVCLAVVWLVRSGMTRNTPSMVRRWRVGLFLERDLLDPNDLPRVLEWPVPPADAVGHDSATGEWPTKEVDRS